MKNDTQILLDSESLSLKSKRIGMEIIEHYSNSKQIVCIGINNRGFLFAQSLLNHMNTVHQLPIQLIAAEVNRTENTAQIHGQIPPNSDVILIDDVMNSGRTLFNLINSIPLHTMLSVRVAVMVDREHKRFPIHADFVGIALSTSLHDYVEIVFENNTMVKAVNVLSAVE